MDRDKKYEYAQANLLVDYHMGHFICPITQYSICAFGYLKDLCHSPPPHRSLCSLKPRVVGKKRGFASSPLPVEMTVMLWRVLLMWDLSGWEIWTQFLLLWFNPLTDLSLANLIHECKILNLRGKRSSWLLPLHLVVIKITIVKESTLHSPVGAIYNIFMCLKPCVHRLSTTTIPQTHSTHCKTAQLIIYGCRNSTLQFLPKSIQSVSSSGFLMLILKPALA